jgi:hypothetical protein
VEHIRRRELISRIRPLAAFSFFEGYERLAEKNLEDRCEEAAGLCGAVSSTVAGLPTAGPAALAVLRKRR